MTSVAALPVYDLTADAFASYGWMLGKPIPQGNGVPLFSNAATDFWQEHVFNTGAGGDAEVLWVNYRSASPEVASLEKHLLTQQAIVPLTGAIIQVVARSAAEGVERPAVMGIAPVDAGGVHGLVAGHHGIAVDIGFLGDAARLGR